MIKSLATLLPVASTRQAPPTTPTQEIIAQVERAARFARQHAIAAIYHAGSGHPGDALSCADIIATLFGAELHLWPDAVNDPQRDRFVLSKSEGAPALYAVAAHYGFCDPREALRLRRLGSPFQGHPHVGDLPWVETSSGPQGQGLSVALGMAMGLRLQKRLSRVYTLLDAAALQEGGVWESAISAAHNRLDNLCVIVDYNKLPADDRNANVIALEPLTAKWRAFDWAVAEIDGHDICALLAHLKRAAATRGRPSAIIARTIKGKGVPMMEYESLWQEHTRLTPAAARDALAVLGANQPEIEAWLDDSDL